MSAFLDKVRAVYDKRGYKFFEEGAYNLNIIGIRSENPIAGKFDDTIGVVYKERYGKWVEKWSPATTDPSAYYLMNPLNTEGTLILLENQYPGAYKKGIHGRTWKGGGYPALEQVKEMAYIRDNNRDEVLDLWSYNPSDIVIGNFKTNIHRASKYQILDKIFKYSAGCQVYQDINDFNFMMDAVDMALQYWKNSFTYTLINQRDLLNI